MRRGLTNINATAVPYKFYYTKINERGRRETRDHDWAICVLERWTARIRGRLGGKNFLGRKKGRAVRRGLAIWRRTASIGRGPEACRERFFARTFSISSAPSVSSDSSYFSSSYHRVARLCMRPGMRYFGAQPWQVDALTRQLDFLIPAPSIDPDPRGRIGEQHAEFHR